MSYSIVENSPISYPTAVIACPRCAHWYGHQERDHGSSACPATETSAGYLGGSEVSYLEKSSGGRGFFNVVREILISRHAN